MILVIERRWNTKEIVRVRALFGWLTVKNWEKKGFVKLRYCLKITVSYFVNLTPDYSFFTFFNFLQNNILAIITTNLNQQNFSFADIICSMTSILYIFIYFILSSTVQLFLACKRINCRNFSNKCYLDETGIWNGYGFNRIYKKCHDIKFLQKKTFQMPLSLSLIFWWKCPKYIKIMLIGWNGQPWKSNDFYAGNSKKEPK